MEAWARQRPKRSEEAEAIIASISREEVKRRKEEEEGRIKIGWGKEEMPNERFLRATSFAKTTQLRTNTLAILTHRL